MQDLSKAHDKFFKEVFSRPEVAEDFVMHYLPPQVSGLLKPNTFRLTKDSFVDESLQEHFSDLVYQVSFRRGQQGFVYILFEHKSSPDPGIAVQLLRYMTRILERVPNPAQGSLPPVIPVVLYHGNTRWGVPLDFASLYQTPESLRESLLNFTYHLCDLSEYTDEEIRQSARAAVALLVLKHIFSANLGDRLGDILGLLRAVNEQTTIELLHTIFVYVGAANARVTKEEYGKALGTAFPERGEKYMNRLVQELIGEELEKRWQEKVSVLMQEGIQKGMEEGIQKGMEEGIQKGMEEGIQKGIEEGRRKGVREGAAFLTIRLLLRKFGSLDEGTQERVRQLSIEGLERLGEDLLDFPDKASLTEWLDRMLESRRDQT